MEKNALTVLLIEDNPQYAELVQQWLSGVAGGGFELNWTDTLAAGMSRLEKGPVDVILLDLNLPDCNGIETYTQTRARAPKIPTLVLTSADNESLALKTIQKGAEDYLVKSNCDADGLIRAIQYAIVRHKTTVGMDRMDGVRNRLIGVIGVKGGVGTTTIACTLASELRDQTSEEVLLADLDPDGGNVSFVMGADCKYSIQDAAAVDRLDLGQWEKIVSHAPGGLSVIASGSQPGDERLVPENIRQVLAFARPLYAWTVLDLGRMNQDSLALLRTVGEILVVTTPTIPALFNAKCATEALRTADIDPERIRMILNHVGERQPASGVALSNMFGVPVFATVPNDTDELFVACVEKRLPGTHSQLRHAVAGMARNLTGQVAPARRGKLTSLLGFADRFRMTPGRVSVTGE